MQGRLILLTTILLVILKALIQLIRQVLQEVLESMLQLRQLLQRFQEITLQKYITGEMVTRQEELF